MNSTPTEYMEQCTFVEWLEWQKLKFTAIPNSTYTKSIKQKIKNNRSGVRAGFPDMVVLIPPKKSKDGQGYFLCIELKRTKGGQLRQTQKEWLAAIEEVGGNVKQAVCKGCDEAVAFVETLII